PLGRHIHDLPLPAHLAAMLLDAARDGAERDAADIAAVLVERGLGGPSSDLDTRLEGFRRDRGPRASDMRRLADGWARTAKSNAAPRSGASRPTSTAALLARAYPGRIAKARGTSGQFILANGRGAVIDATDALARVPFMVIAEMQGVAAATRILLAARLDPTELDQIAADRLETIDDISFDPSSLAVRGRRVRRLGAIVLDSAPLSLDKTQNVSTPLALGIAKAGVDKLPWSKAQNQLRDRVAFLSAADPDTWPDLSDAALANTITEWLVPFLDGKSRLSDIGVDDLDAALMTVLPWSLRQRLEADAPTHFDAPTGNRHPIAYDGPGAPSLSIRVQELFGLSQHPAIAGGKLPLTLELLSPAHRPIQITRDLPGFWRGSWADVRSDLRGRYPRHSWPEDPANAAPTARAKPRGT
ncbi:MAG: ATP-dependent helicase C-terminal domain-containing protein, partial [Hyphomicrobiaceae bacterium]